MAGPFIPKCKISEDRYSLTLGRYKYSCTNTQLRYACKIKEWIWIDTSDYYPYGYDLDAAYSYKEGSGHRVE